MRAAKELQKQLQDKGLYKEGSVNGLWNSKWEATWKQQKEAEGRGGIFIAELGIAIDPDRAILSEAKLKALRQWAKVLLGYQEYNTHCEFYQSTHMVRIGRTDSADSPGLLSNL